MDKHTKRYLYEEFKVSGPLDFEKMASFVNQLDVSSCEMGYIHSAIEEFEGNQKNYLQMKLWDFQYGRD